MDDEVIKIKRARSKGWFRSTGENRQKIHRGPRRNDEGHVYTLRERSAGPKISLTAV